MSSVQDPPQAGSRTPSGTQIKLILGAVVAALALAFDASTAAAATTWFVAPGGNDTNDCAAATAACATINAAFAKPGFAAGDTVKVASGTYTVPDFSPQNEVVRISMNATLLGGWNANYSEQTGVSVIEARGQSLRRGVTVDSGIAATIDSFVIQNGLAPSPGGGGIRNDGDLRVTNTTIQMSSSGGGIVGGGILNVGKLHLQRSQISGNMAAEGAGIANGGTLIVVESHIRTNSGGSGAGIQNYSTATATILASTISGNTSRTRGAGIFTEGLVVLTNSTISGNRAEPPWDGGGIYLSGSSPQAYLNNTTVTNNSAGRAGGINGGILRNSIVAGNTATEFAPDCDSNIFVPLVSSAGHNLIGSTSGCFFTPATGDLLNLAPVLGPLTDNGGETPTHALLENGPAVDAGHPSGCTDQSGAPLLTDQRGVARLAGACDIGAYERMVSGPAGSWGRINASFALSSVPGGGSFECRVNGGAWAACSSPYVVSTVVPGYYLYEFRAVNGAGADATPVAVTLRVVRPFAVDWDGDGKANVAVWRPKVGGWYVQGQSTNWFGLNGDVPVPGQWDADPAVDRAIWRPAVGGWYVEGSATVYHGAQEDVPVPADWDGNGVLDHIVWRPAHGGWYVRGVGTFYWGQRGDVPVLGDYDADPQLDLAVYRNGAWYIEGSATVFHGQAGDIPVPADWDGNGKTDIAVYRPSNSTWYIRNISTTPFGITGDVPIVGDFDADPAVDRAIWRPDSGGWYVEGSPPIFFGLATDIP